MLGWLLDRLYREFAWAYDVVSWLVSGGRWQDWQRSALPFLVGRRILDVGCGPGHLLLRVLATGYAAYGLELSPFMVRRAASLLGQHGCNGRLVRGDARAMPFADGTFDTVVLTFPPPFVRDPAFWKEAVRVTGSGGRIVIVEEARSNTRFWPGILERAWGTLARQDDISYHEPTDAPVVAHHTIATTPRGTVSLIIADVSPRPNG